MKHMVLYRMDLSWLFPLAFTKTLLGSAPAVPMSLREVRKSRPLAASALFYLKPFNYSLNALSSIFQGQKIRGMIVIFAGNLTVKSVNL